jgi:hypothetical protein
MKILLIFTFIFVKSLFCSGESPLIVSKEIYKCNEDTSVYIKIIYPQLINLENQKVQTKINSFLKNQFLEPLNTYEDFISDTEWMADYPADWEFNFEVSFRTTYISPDFLSIVMDYYEFTGGVHGNYYSVGYNFKLSDGSLLQLTDIINNSNLKNLAVLCELETLKQFNANSLFDAGLFQDEIHILAEQDFFIKPGYLVIQFDPYEIAPYSMGSIEIELSFDKIKNLIKPYLPF